MKLFFQKNNSSSTKKEKRITKPKERQKGCRIRCTTSGDHSMSALRKAHPFFYPLTLLCGLVIGMMFLFFLTVLILYRADAFTICLTIVILALDAVAVFLFARNPAWIRWVLCVGMCFYLLTFIAFSIFIGVLSQNRDVPQEECVLLVFGCRTYGMTPGRELTLRLDSALDFLTQHPDAICIVSGGQGPNETVPEAIAMKGYLVDHGISADRVFTEASSSSTIENLKFSLEILEKEGKRDLPVIALSSSYHLARIELLGWLYDVPFAAFIGAEVENPPIYFYDLMREYLAFWKLLFVH